MKTKKLNAFVVIQMLLLLCVNFINAQKTVTGTVMSKSLQPIPGVNVLLEGTDNGTVTDFDGNYSIKINKSRAVLVFSYLGFVTQKAPIGSKKKIDLILLEDSEKLDEVVVIGYGSSRKKDLTSSVSVIDVKDLATGQTPRFEQMLTGRAAGVNVSSVNSEPGAALKIRIRGNNSLTGDNSPLLVVDGVLGGDFEALNPNDIESMQILKDASATSIYGSQGANGVIIVTTKQGKNGKLSVSFSSTSGVQSVRKKLDLLTAEEHIAVLESDTNFNFPDDINGLTNPILSGEGTDWQDEIFQMASYQNHHIDVKGGVGNLRAYTSIDYLDQEGVIKGSDYKKLNGRANITYKASNKFTIKNNIAFYNTESNQVRTNEGYGSLGGPVTINAASFSPIIPVFAEDGSYNGPLNTASIRDNPVALVDNLEDLYTQNYFRNVLSTNWKISKNLTYDFSYTFSNRTIDNKRYTSKILRRALNLGEARLDNRQIDTWQLRNLLTYKKSVNNHNFNVLAGHEMIENSSFRTIIEASGFPTDALGYNAIQLADQILEYSTEDSVNSLLSFFTRFTYGYNDKYLFSISARADGSSKFAANNKWGYFSAGSLAWVASEEPFLQDNTTISFLKFRTSYGETGSQAINPYQSLAAYSLGQLFSDGTDNINANGAIIDRVANPNLKWETTAQFDFGLDLELFDGKIGIVADYFNKQTTDLLFNRRLLPHTGIADQVQNIGSMENVGYEFTLDAKLFDNDFKWNTSANISIIENKVLDLGGEDDLFLVPPSGSRGSGFSTTGILRVGEPIGNFFGYVADGIFKSQEDLDAIDQPGGVLGDVRYADISGPDGVPDGVIDDNDRKIIGNALPDFTFGFSNNFRYKNFDLNVLMQGSIGFDVVRFDKGRILNEERFNGWSEDNTDTDIPRNGFLGNVANSNYVEDASFVKFKNISLGYNFPLTTVEKLGLNSLKIYLSAIDAIVLTDYSGYDPEVSSFANGETFQQNVSIGYDSGGYPGISQYVFGLNLSF